MFPLSRPSLSYEFFPPKDSVGEDALWSSFALLLETNPDFVTVTYGAGGSNQERSIALVAEMAKQVKTVAHLTCVNASRSELQTTIRKFADAGAAAILALRGDPPLENGARVADTGELKTALELIELIRQTVDLPIAVGAFPEVHPESPNMQHDSSVLALKQQAGADFAITQLFFSLQAYQTMASSLSSVGVTIPVIPGLMPIANSAQVFRMAKLSGAQVPDQLVASLEGLSELEAKKKGMDFSARLGAELLQVSPGLHIYTLNQSAAAIQVAEESGILELRRNVTGRK